MKTTYLPLFAAAVLCLTSCRTVPAGPTQHETRSVAKDSAEKLRTDVRMSAGTLKITGGSSDWMRGDFAYNVPEWKPKVDYVANSGRGTLTIEQPKSSEMQIANNTVNEWDLRLNDTVPTELTIRMGAGEAKLELGTISLRGLDIEMGAGELRLDLRGNPNHSYDVRIRGGAGEATVYVPKGAGIDAKAKGGIGEVSMRGLRAEGDHWVNDANGKAKIQINLDIQGGVGQITVIAE